PKPGDPPMPRPRPMIPPKPMDQKPMDTPAGPMKDPKKVEKGLIKRTNEAKDHEYWMFVPENYDPNIAYGLVIWLHAAGHGGKDADDVRKIWEDYCEKNNL